MREYLPAPVFDRIQRHLIAEANAAEDGWDAGADEEDTLTGHLGARLQTQWSQPIWADEQLWRWRVRYKKFRGRGPGAFERTIGADGIIQVEIEFVDRAESVFKAVLFQAKKGDYRRARSALTGQVQNMEAIAPGASVIVEYRPERYRAIEGHEYLQQIRDRAVLPRESGERLGNYLGQTFLTCGSGLLGMYYDASRRLLVVPTGGVPRLLRVDLGHRVSVDVEQLGGANRL